MPRNQGHTTLKRQRRPGCAMRDYDRLPKELRQWLANATLPWRARSVRQAYAKALARTNDANLALAELDRLQAKLVARDTSRIWGQTHPNAA